MKNSTSWPEARFLLTPPEPSPALRRFVMHRVSRPGRQRLQRPCPRRRELAKSSWPGSADRQWRIQRGSRFRSLQAQQRQSLPTFQKLRQMPNEAPSELRPSRELCKTSGEYRQPQSGEPKRTSLPKGNPATWRPCPRRVTPPAASFPDCRQYGGAEAPCVPPPASQATDPAERLRKIPERKARVQRRSAAVAAASTSSVCGSKTTP